MHTHAHTRILLSGYANKIGGTHMLLGIAILFALLFACVFLLFVMRPLVEEQRPNDQLPAHAVGTLTDACLECRKMNKIEEE
jgi:hypothetical protein